MRRDKNIRTESLLCASRIWRLFHATWYSCCAGSICGSAMFENVVTSVCLEYWLYVWKQSYTKLNPGGTEHKLQHSSTVPARYCAISQYVSFKRRRTCPRLALNVQQFQELLRPLQHLSSKALEVHGTPPNSWTQWSYPNGHPSSCIVNRRNGYINIIHPKIKVITTSYPRGTGREADHAPPSSAEVKNAWTYTSTPPSKFSWRGT